MGYMLLSHETQGYASGRTPLLTVPQLAAVLGVHRVTVYRLAIPYVLVGSRRRYRPEDVDAYLEARKVAASP
jgi:excisionase family DNA binding protein